MVSSGVDSNKNVYPIRVDSSGSPYVLLSDGAETANVDTSNRLEVSVLNLKPDGTNTLACLDANTRAGYIKVTDGSNEVILDTDDDNIANAQKTLLVINLGYVYDSDNSKWVRQTPTAAAVQDPVLVFSPTQDNVDYNPTAGTWATSTHGDTWANRKISNTSNAQNDEISLGHFHVPSSGNYSVLILYYSNPDAGIAHAMVNGADEGTLDMYAAGAVANVIGTIDMGTLTAGLKHISLKAATKNGSSAGYILYINAVLVVRD